MTKNRDDRPPTGAGQTVHRPSADRIFFVPAVVAYVGCALALVFLASMVAPRAVIWLFGAPGLSPSRFFAGPAANGGVSQWLAPLFSHVFLHANLPHILFNGLWLVVFGTPVARRLASALRFFAFFMLCGAAGGFFYAAFNARDPVLLVGASGAVTGLLGGLVRFGLQTPRHGEAPRHRLPISHPGVLSWSAIVIALNASVAVIGPGFGADGASVAWQAHIGGYMFGLLAFPLFDRRP